MPRDKSCKHGQAEGKVACAISGQWEGILEGPVEWEGSAAFETSSKTGPGLSPGASHHDGCGRVNHYQPDQEPAAISIHQITQE